MLVLGIYKFKFRIKTWHRFHEKKLGTQFSVGKKTDRHNKRFEKSPELHQM